MIIYCWYQVCIKNLILSVLSKKIILLILCAYHCHAPPPPTRGRVGDYVGICQQFAARGVGHLTRSKQVQECQDTCSIVFLVGICRGFACQSLPHPWGIVKTTSANPHIAPPRPVLGVVGREAHYTSLTYGY